MVETGLANILAKKIIEHIKQYIEYPGHEVDRHYPARIKHHFIAGIVV